MIRISIFFQLTRPVHSNRPDTPKRAGYALAIMSCLALLSIVAHGQSPPKANPVLSHRISFEEARRIVSTDDEGNLMRQPDRFTRTRTRGGQVIEIYYPLNVSGRTRGGVPGYGILYPSEAAFREATRPHHMLEDLIPDAQVFVSQIPQLIARLEKRLHLTPGQLQFSRLGLRKVDGYLRLHHASHTTAQTDARLFQELTAYYGETLRQSANGQWRIHEERVSELHRQSEPNLVLSHGVEVKPWSSVIRALYDEDNRGIGLTRSFDSDLNPPARRVTR